MDVIRILLEMVGGLAIFMFGMQMSSDGMQKAAGDRLQRVLNFMTGNRVLAVLTGFIITVLVQSSSASTVMFVSFVNAGLLDLVQAIGCIMGANIGTTVTGWLISLVGVKFSIKAFAVPIIALGFFMSLSKKRRAVQGWGSALMGFGFIFLGLELLSGSVPKPDANALLFLDRFANLGVLTTLICVVVGAVFTALVNASSAAQAIIITLAMQGVLTYEMAVALMLGANIGTCTDAFLVSFGANTAAKRAAWAHILFNVFGTIWAVIFFGFFIKLVDWITPGIPTENMALHIAMMHTVFNGLNTLLLLPFLRQYATLISRFIKPSKEEAEGPYRFAFVSSRSHDAPGLNLLQARGEVVKMTKLARETFVEIREALADRKVSIAVRMDRIKYRENRADEMKEELSRYLIACSNEKGLAEDARSDVAALIKVVDDLEDITDICYHLAMLLERAEIKRHEFDPVEVERLLPYTLLVDASLSFVEAHVGSGITDADVEAAKSLEDKVDEFKSELKKVARKRLESGGDVRTELLYIDIVRNIEKVADCAFSITINLGHDLPAVRRPEFDDPVACQDTPESA